MDIDEENNKYLVIHSGSRNLGMQVEKIYEDLAYDECKGASQEKKDALVKQYVQEGRQGEIPDLLVEISKEFAEKTKIPRQFCYLEGSSMQSYMHDMRLCQEFAALNRQAMADKIIKFLNIIKFKQFDTPHNYIDEFNIVRKGSIAAPFGKQVIIPMNMRDGCLLAVGKGNEDWNSSAPHGAGRLFKRGDTFELFSLEEYQHEMEGIYSSTVKSSNIDESPMAYKPMDEIVEQIKDTVDIIKVIKPIYNFKA